MVKFPANPTDGMVFEVTPGSYYVYEHTTNSWVKVVGEAIFPLASPVANGLMSSVDLRKINRIVAPPPISTITGQNCSGKFISGDINIYGNDDYIKITGTPTLRNNGAAGNYPWRLTQHTFGFDFTLDKDALVAELLSRGQLKVQGKQGPKGDKGDKGDPGGSLATGPKGSKGDPGDSPPCTLAIVPETLATEILPGTNSAIVDIETRQTSDTEFELVLKRGTVGNPDAAPKKVNVNCSDKSIWVVAVENPLGPAQDLYYVDLTSILDALFEKFKSELARIKRGHEEVVHFWLTQMSALFHAQKAVLCCALTTCILNNKDRPTNTRLVEQPIEVIDLSNVTGGGSGFLPQGIMAAVDNSQDDMLLISGPTNSGTLQQAAQIDLQPGKYAIEIIDCCIKSGDEYAGNLTITYNTQNGPATIQFLKPGRFASLGVARTAYLGLSIEIDHSGGPVSAYLPSTMMHDHDGDVMLHFIKKSSKPAPPPKSTRTASSLICSMPTKLLKEYEDSWYEGKCCGLVTRIANQDYIVVKRSIGDDTSCGGGESESSPCIQHFKDLIGHPSFAWPTLDGHTFMPLPAARVVSFKYDRTLNDLVMRNLDNQLYVNPQGSPDEPDQVHGNVPIGKGHRGLVKQLSAILFPVT